MSQQYNADQAIIENSSKIIDETRAQLRAKVQQLNGQMAEVSGQWRGQGEVAFQNVQNTWTQQAQRIVAVLDDFQQNLRTNAAQYNSDDTQTAEGLNKFMGRLGG